MSQNHIRRPVLGQRVDLGTLYDARVDRFVERSLLSGPFPEATAIIIENPTSQLKRISSDSYSRKFDNLKISTELGASWLSGMFDVAGAAEYLKDERSSTFIEQTSIQYSITTVDERLGFGNPELMPYITLDSIQGSGATHVLAVIGWGAETIVTAKCQSSDRSDFEDCMSREFSRLQHIIQNEGQDEPGSEHVLQNEDISLDVTVYSDLLPYPGPALGLRNGTGYLLELPDQTAACNGGKGMPVHYTLVPLDLLRFTLNVEVKTDAVSISPSPNCLEGFLTFLDELRDTQRKLQDCYSEISEHRHCVPETFMESVMHCLSGFGDTERSLRSNLGRQLYAVRANQSYQSCSKSLGVQLRHQETWNKWQSSIEIKYFLLRV